MGTEHEKGKEELKGKKQLFVGQGYLEEKQANGRRRTSRMSGLKMFKHVQVFGVLW